MQEEGGCGVLHKFFGWKKRALTSFYYQICKNFFSLKRGMCAGPVPCWICCRIAAAFKCQLERQQLSSVLLVYFIFQENFINISKFLTMLIDSIRFRLVLVVDWYWWIPGTWTSKVTTIEPAMGSLSWETRKSDFLKQLVPLKKCICCTQIHSQ